MGKKGKLLVGLGLFIPEDPAWSKGRFSFFSAAAVESTGIHWAVLAAPCHSLSKN